MAKSFTEQTIQDQSRALQVKWKKRNERLQAIYDLRRLTDQNAGKKGLITTYVSNRPKVAFNIFRHMLSSRSFQPRVKMGNPDRGELRDTGITERAILSIARDLNAQYLRQGRLPFEVELADQALMGWVNVFRTVAKNPDGSPRFIADIWDNMTVYHEADEDGLLTVMHRYPASWNVALAKARRQDKELRQTMGRGNKPPTTAWVEDFYQRDGDAILHGLLIDSQEVMPLEPEDGFKGEMPVLILPVNGEAMRFSTNAKDDPSERMFASILDGMERTTKDFNDWMTIIKDGAARMTQRHYVSKSEDAQGVAEVQELHGPAAVFNLRLDESLDALEMGQLPSEIQAIAAILQGDMARASIPDTLFANVAADTSGFLFSQLQSAALTNEGPYLRDYTFALEDIFQTLVEGFRDGGFKAITIQGRTNADSATDGFFLEEWDPKDIGDPVWVGIQKDLALPRNRVQEINVMRLANSGTPNLLDEVTLLDEIGGFADPFQIMERKRRDMVLNLPQTQLINAGIEYERLAAEYREAGDELGARFFDRATQSIIAALLQPQEGQDGRSPAAPGMRPEAGGVLSRNGSSPNEVRAMAGRQPPQRGGL